MTVPTTNPYSTCGGCGGPAVEQAPLDMGWGEVGICAGCLSDVGNDFPQLVAHLLDEPCFYCAGQPGAPADPESGPHPSEVPPWADLHTYRQHQLVHLAQLLAPLFDPLAAALDGTQGYLAAAQALLAALDEPCLVCGEPGPAVLPCGCTADPTDGSQRARAYLFGKLGYQLQAAQASLLASS